MHGCGRVWLVGALVSLAPLSALAQPAREPATAAAAPTYSLSWVRAEGAEACPAAAVLAAEVERRLGRAVFDTRAERSIEVDVMRFGERYRSDVYVRDAAGHALGHRQLESDEPGCGALLSATALAVALVIDPEAASREPAPAPAAASFAPPPPAPAPPPPPPPPAIELKQAGTGPVANPRPETVASRDFTSDIGLRATYNLGLVPAAAPGAQLAFSARLGSRWGFALSADYVASRRATRGIGSLDVGLTRGSVLVTYDLLHRPGFQRLWLGLGPTLGAFHVAVRTPAPVTDSGDFAFTAGEARAELQVAASKRIFFHMGASALVAPWRQEFLVRRQQEAVWRQPLLSGSGFLGLGMSFP